MATRKPKPEKHITEVHPNPHGEQDVAEMPLQTDHGHVTRQNAGGSSSTAGNRLNPSVTGPLEDPTDDSMFNNADPQTRELMHGTPQKKRSKQRKIA